MWPSWVIEGNPRQRGSSFPRLLIRGDNGSKQRVDLMPAGIGKASAIISFMGVPITLSATLFFLGRIIGAANSIYQRAV